MRDKKSFFESSMCEIGNNCEKCRVSKQYREGISKVFDVPEVDFKCPKGKIAEEYKDIEFPNIFGLAKNLLETGKDVAKHKKKTGRVKASEELQAKRLATCKACNYYIGNRCKKCGCRLTAKIDLEAAKCPLKKWLSDK